MLASVRRSLAAVLVITTTVVVRAETVGGADRNGGPENATNTNGRRDVPNEARTHHITRAGPLRGDDSIAPREHPDRQ